MTVYARIYEGLVAELFETDGDITTMFHPDLIWVEVPEGLAVVVGWAYSEGVFSPPPPPSHEELLAAAESQRTNLMAWATTKIAPLQDAVDLDEATPAEVAALKAWKQYRVALNRLPDSAGWPENVIWPASPED